MASYPTSVKAFTTKNTGDVVQSAHVNDIQDEVAAIEAGLRNGTAPINAAGSTLTSLSVTGNSTLAAVQGGASTFASLQVSGNSSFANRPVFTPPESALVYMESTGAVASSVFSTVSFTAEAFVTNAAMHSTASSPERLVPQSTGFYKFTAQITLDTPSVAQSYNVTIRDSSNTAIAAQSAISWAAPGAINVTGYKRYDALGGYATCRYHNFVGTSTMSLSSGVGVSWFAMVKL